MRNIKCTIERPEPVPHFNMIMNIDIDRKGQVAQLGRASGAGILNSQPCRDMPTSLPCPLIKKEGR
jgi:hypothetical protein